MPTLNQRRASLLKSENIAVENTGDVYLLQGIFKHTDPLDWRTVKGLSKYYYGDVAADTLPDGYASHPISWFYEDEAVNHIPEISNMVKPTFEELYSMPDDERINVLADLFPIGTIIKDDCYNDEIKIVFRILSKIVLFRSEFNNRFCC